MENKKISLPQKKDYNQCKTKEDNDRYLIDLWKFVYYPEQFPTGRKIYQHMKYRISKDGFIDAPATAHIHERMALTIQYRKEATGSYTDPERLELVYYDRETRGEDGKMIPVAKKPMIRKGQVLVDADVNPALVAFMELTPENLHSAANIPEVNQRRRRVRVKKGYDFLKPKIKSLDPAIVAEEKKKKFIADQAVYNAIIKMHPTQLEVAAKNLTGFTMPSQGEPNWYSMLQMNLVAFASANPKNFHQLRTQLFANDTKSVAEVDTAIKMGIFFLKDRQWWYRPENAPEEEVFGAYMDTGSEDNPNQWFYNWLWNDSSDEWLYVLKDRMSELYQKGNLDREKKEVMKEVVADNIGTISLKEINSIKTTEELDKMAKAMGVKDTQWDKFSDEEKRIYLRARLMTGRDLTTA